MTVPGRRCPSGLQDETGCPELDDPWELAERNIAERERREIARILQDQTDKEEAFRERRA